LKGAYILPVPDDADSVAWIGARSYAIYLIHPPVFNATYEIWFQVRQSAKKPAHLRAMALLVTF